MFDAVLVANRGEIAVRVIETLRRLGIRAIAVYSDADAAAPHVQLADESIRLGPAPAAQSYLHAGRVIEAAVAAGAGAIHPGYGFLSENAGFARACARAEITFIGPPPEAIESLGDKVSAKLLAEQAGVPVLPGLHEPGLTDRQIIEFAGGEGAMPLMVKAAAGGGGRGMRIVRAAGELPAALAAARREAKAGFGDDSLLVERYVERARHIEVQLLADAHGNVVHLGERECSLQRRHQKVVEESPSAVVTPELRARLGAAAAGLAKQAGYVGAGTAEFLVSDENPEQFFFLEVNARLQVEHPVTELVTGLDLVEQQLRVAAGEPLELTQRDVALSGHAVEVRLCAEDPAADFLPSTGTVRRVRWPQSQGIRVDTGIEAGSVVTSHYDSLLAKVIAAGRDREEALERLSRALGEVRVLGVTTNGGFLARLIDAPEVRAGRLDTKLIERGAVAAVPDAEAVEEAAIALAAIELLALHEAGSGADPWTALVSWRIDGRRRTDFELEQAGVPGRLEVVLEGNPDGARATLGASTTDVVARRVAPGRVAVRQGARGRVWDHAAAGAERWVSAGADAFQFTLVEPAVQGGEASGDGALEAPMPGTVLAVNVAAGDDVREGDVLVVVESMKMELSLTAPGDARVAQVHVSAGQGVAQGESLVELELSAV